METFNVLFPRVQVDMLVNLDKLEKLDLFQDNVEKMDKFLDTYNLTALNQEELENLSEQIWIKEIKSVISILLTKSPGPDSITVNFTKYFSKNYHKSFTNSKKKKKKKPEKEGTLSNSFHETSVILIIKAGKVSVRKETYQPIS